MSILVTGGIGYIGSHTVVELLNRTNHQIVVVDNLSNAKLDVIDRIKEITGKNFDFYKIDIRDEAGLNKIFTDHSIEAVIHFAGLKAVGESVGFPLRYYENNINGTMVLCKVMEEHGCKRMVFSSSATVYGMHNPVPFKEGMPIWATNPYGFTKVMIEQILTDLHIADPDWSISLLRYFNPIGAHESGLIGENPNGIPNNLLPYVAKVALGQLEKVNVFGSDYDTPDGTGVRDYIHVVDLAIGHLDALEYILKHTGVEAINLGTGEGYSVLEIIHAFSAACGKELPYTLAERRPGDIATSYADSSKAKTLLGWQAKRGISQMCEDAWRYAKSNVK